MLYPNELRARSVPHTKIGRGGGIRTPDILLPKQTRYQAALRPVQGVHHTDERRFSQHENID
jgi:hypothetical protein